MKSCTNANCKQQNPQPLSDFRKDLDTKSLLSSWCKDCHSTNKIRGLLCNNCNRGIGLLEDSVILLTKAINHLNQIGISITDLS